MKSAILRRVITSGAGTFGVLLVNGLPICTTLELPWQNNRRNISCIPAGHYHLKRYRSDTHGATWRVLPVDDRGHILIHKGNALMDTKGCILVGLRYGDIGTHYGVRQSRDAFKVLQAELGDADCIPFVITSAV